MTGGKILDRIQIDLRGKTGLCPVYIDVFDNSLSRKWLSALNNLLANNYHLEKNYCFFGFADSDRNGQFLLDQINASIDAINQSDIGYHIDNAFTMANSVAEDGGVNHDQFNLLHRYFEDLQGSSGNISEYYWKANNTVRWHIRQLNLLCHEFESWQLSWRKKHTAPEWQRPSQLMCWLNAPRFALEPEDYELFGIETMNRSLGGVYVGVNKAVGKHHYEVFMDEGRDSRIGELTTTGMRSQTEAAGDFDIEWANNPGAFYWQIENLKNFRIWLVDNGFDPDDKTLTIGHPKVGQVDLQASFGTQDYKNIWPKINSHLDVWSVKTSTAHAVYDYHWADADFIDRQIKTLR